LVEFITFLTLLPHGLETLCACQHPCAPFPYLHDKNLGIIDVCGSITWLQCTRGQVVHLSFFGRQENLRPLLALQSTWDDKTDSMSNGPSSAHSYGWRWWEITWARLYSLNKLIPISLYFCFLSIMVVGSIKDLHEVGVPHCSTSLSGRLEIKYFTSTILSGPWGRCARNLGR
jgi:hypothetical protein